MIVSAPFDGSKIDVKFSSIGEETLNIILNSALKLIKRFKKTIDL